MWVRSQLLRVRLGWIERTMLAAVRARWSLCVRPVGSGGGGHGVCEETERLQTRWLALEGCVLFPVGLKESSLCCFRLLTRVPSGLLRVSWPKPRKEMMQFWLLVSQADPLFRRHKERTFRQRLPVVLKSSDCLNQLRAASGWIPTCLSRCDMSEPECGRFRIKLWCHSFRKDFALLFLLSYPCLPPSLSPPTSPYFSNLASTPWWKLIWFVHTLNNY